MSQRTTRGEGHQIIGQEISWAGDCPWTGTPGFGTESGLFLVAPSASANGGVLPPVKVALDSVNGVAFNGEIAAFSSRESLFLARRNRPGHIDLDPIRLPYEGGAHGVVSSSLGGFIAPVGPSGVLLLSSTKDEKVFDVRLAQRGDDPLYAYRLIMAGLIDDETEVIAFAAREQGVVAFGYAGGSKVTASSGHLFTEQDIVSLCSLNHTKLPRGVAALSRDCKIILIRDVTKLTDVGALDYAEIEGTGYDLLSSQGHLFVLTSELFVTLAGVVDEFANGRLPSKRQTASFMRAQGVALYPAGDRGMHLIDGKGVTEFPVSELVGSSGHARSRYQQPEELTAEVMDIETRAFIPSWSTQEAALELAVA
jgi:hypothetical protein